MKEKVNVYIQKIKDIWRNKTNKQKWILIGSVVLAIVFIAVASWFVTKPTMIPLYSDLSPAETGSIKENVDAKGIKTEIADNGTTILVPKEQVDTLKVQLASEGLPETGSIDYSFFSQNAKMGLTDNEFNVLKLESTQTELANLIKQIDGVQNAKVMISMPEKGVFVTENNEQASASIVLEVKPGYRFQDDQIKALYHLVSKSIPNLPEENIAIMNQNFEYYDLNNDSKLANGSSIVDQFAVKKQIERDIQRQVQTMLGTIMGQDKVVASVTADVDFSQEKREENLVTPVDEENMAGIAISAKKLSETFSGKGAGAGGVPQGEDSSDAIGSSSQYVEGSDNNGDYEKTEETINNEVNRIKKEVVESPYKVKDLGIQVMVEPPNAKDPNSLPQERIDDINKILGTIIRTTIDKNEQNEPLSDEDVDQKIAVSVQTFNGKVTFDDKKTTAIPLWAYIVGGVLLAALIILLILFLRSRKNRIEEEELVIEEQEEFDVPDVNAEQETEGTMKRKQLEKMAKEKPDEFAKLLRTWLSQD
ncbi:flagellar basal-body MS-ring/collar protein FliF [Bacillus testis]|uniref:flagellar basal-body MS-ring/collar protein FliF n=1 Tax=Bacillus testis TaxID=1622072 RepID=UPI00067EE24B|nr:flagellar basal-body MS-ring/collar protein FliF [Bacillus testis]